MKILLDFDPCARKLYVFDSFIGFPELHPADFNGTLIKGNKGDFSSTLDTFKSNLRLFHVYNPNIIVITKGWFNETCPTSPVDKISFLRLDGDLYASTMDALNAFYHKVVPGGYIYVDDYGSYNGCKQAIDEFRLLHNIDEEIKYVIEFERKGSYRYEAIWWKKRKYERPLSTNIY